MTALTVLGGIWAGSIVIFIFLVILSKIGLYEFPFESDDEE